MDDESEESVNTLSVFFPEGGTRCTESFSRFLDEFRSHSDFFFFVAHLVGRADENRVTAAKALLPGARNEDERRKYEETINTPDLVLQKLQNHSRVLSQTLTNGIVNSFQRYFSSIIQSVALKRPVVLTSSQSVKVDDVLRFSRHKDLVSFIIDKKINELSYGGLGDLEKYFNERLGIAMFKDDQERKLLRLFIESRNINVHNGGIVNEVFSRRIGNVDKFPYKSGKVFHLDLDDLAMLSDNAMRVALEIDGAVGAKFSLRCRSYKDWRAKRDTEAKPINPNQLIR